MIRRTIKAIYLFLLFLYYKNISKDLKKCDEIIFDGARDLGGVYIKLLQFVSLRTDVFTLNNKAKFLTFYDAAPVEEFDIQNYLKHELGEKSREIILEDDKPFAAGTFGQVYKGKLLDGTEVVIKVKKDDLLRKLKADFRLLGFLGFLFNLFVEQKMVNVQRTIREFEQTSISELDYKQEVENALSFYEIYKNHERVYIPYTFKNLSTNNIIVQEYVGGVSLTELIRFKQNGGEYGRWLKENYNTDPVVVLPNISYEIMIQGLIQSRYYGDPHPGNIKILPNNKFAFIDFGIAEKSPHGMKSYYKILKNFAKDIHDIDWEDLGKNFMELGARDMSRHIETFDSHFGSEDANLMKTILENYVDLTQNIRSKYYAVDAQGKQDFIGIMFDMTRLGERFGVEIPEGMSRSMRSFFIFKDYAMYLEPTLHFSRYNFQRVMKEISEDQVIEEQQKTRAVTIEESLEKIYDWAGNIAEIDMGLYRKIESRLTATRHVQ